MKDTYKEVKTINFPGMVARVHIPHLSDEEKARRLEDIRKATANLFRG